MSKFVMTALKKLQRTSIIIISKRICNTRVIWPMHAAHGIIHHRGIKQKITIKREYRPELCGK